MTFTSMQKQSGVDRPGVGIRAVGIHLPERVVSNNDLTGVIRTSDEWIVNNIGVRTRRHCAADEWSSDLGAGALQDACRLAGVGVDSIDLVVCGTASPDNMTPATAIKIMRKLGMSGVPGFDVNSGGCPGSIFALDVGAKFVASGGYRRVAVVLTDTPTKVLDPEDRMTAVIFGDGAACYLVERTAPGTGLSPATLASAPESFDTAYIDRGPRTFRDGSPKRSMFGDNFFVMNGRAVRDFALEQIPGFVERLVKSDGLALEDVDLFVFHQANYHLVMGIMSSLGIPADKTWTTVQKYGNTSGSSVPLALRDAIDHDRVKPGDVVVLVAFGAGIELTAGSWCGGPATVTLPSLKRRRGSWAKRRDEQRNDGATRRRGEEDDGHESERRLRRDHRRDLRSWSGHGETACHGGHADHPAGPRSPARATGA